MPRRTLRYSRKKARLGKIKQIVISKAIPRPGGGAAHSPIKSVNWSGRGFIGEFTDDMCDPAPDCHAVIIPGGRELVGTGSAFLERFLAVPLQHELRRAPNIDLVYHAAKVARPRSIKV